METCSLPDLIRHSSVKSRPIEVLVSSSVKCVADSGQGSEDTEQLPCVRCDQQLHSLPSSLRQKSKCLASLLLGK